MTDLRLFDSAYMRPASRAATRLAMVDFPAPIIPSIKIRCVPTGRPYGAARTPPVRAGNRKCTIGSH
jgi:hypothetical protein